MNELKKYCKSLKIYCHIAKKYIKKVSIFAEKMLYAVLIAFSALRDIKVLIYMCHICTKIDILYIL